MVAAFVASIVVDAVVIGVVVVAAAAVQMNSRIHNLLPVEAKFCHCCHLD